MPSEKGRSRRGTPIPTPDSPAPKTRWAKGEWWEWLLIFFAIAALWPKVLSWPGIWWDIILWVALGLMVWVTIRRSKRLKREWKDRS